jgi:hexosaminidase
LFPDPYFHIGGDEINPKEWNASPSIQAYIKQKGLANNEALHAEFNRRLLEFLKNNGKTMVGWDEVLNPGVPKEVVIESWRGPKGLVQAAQQGYRVILANGYYLDLNQPAAQHYLVDPFGGEASKLTPDQAQKVLGGEACMWSEWISPENLDIRLWPRLAAVAERLWSPRDVKDVASLYRRLEDVTLYLDLMGMQLKSNQARMLKRMAGQEHIQALSALAAVVEPPKEYARSSFREYKVTYPLNRLVDAVSPESLAARSFLEVVSSGTPGPGVKAKLEAWRDSHAQLLPTLQRSYLLEEVIPLSQGLSQTAQIGLDALASLEAGQTQTAAWRKEKLDALASIGMVAPKPEETAFCHALLAEYNTPAATVKKRCEEPRPAADLTLALKPAVTKLVEQASR